MFDALPPPPHYRPAPRWGTIILTGIVAAAIVILGGMLISRVMDGSDQADELILPSATFSQQASGAALLAREVPHEGRWTVRVDVEAPSGESFQYENTGTGYFIVPPQYEAPPGSRLKTSIEYQIAFTVPGMDYEQISSYSTQAAYFNALPQTFYAVYGEEDQFLGIRDQAAVNVLARRGNLRVEPFTLEGN